jgi:predicted dehydrogenase
MASGKLRIGFVGAGGIVRQRHAPGLKAVPDVEFVGVVNRSRESSERAAQEFGIARVYDTWQQLVESDDIDIVWIGTHPYMHREITVAALEAGKHVFCQARMAMDYLDGKLMWEASKKHNRTTMICPPPHFMRGDRFIRRLLSEGFVGEPRNVVVQSFSTAYADADAPLHWRQDEVVSGYNTLDLGMMVEVTQRWMGYAKRVTALSHTFVTERLDADGELRRVGRPDAVVVAAELDSGALATISCSGVARHAGDVNGFEVYGSEGTIRYTLASDFKSDRVYLSKSDDPTPVETAIPADEARAWTVEADFINGVREGKRSVEPSFWDGLKYMEMTEAIFKSAETGRTVELPFERLTPA